MRHWNVHEGSTVAVVGLGGLGHVAVKLAAAMGADVAVLSRSDNKRNDALRLGTFAAVRVARSSCVTPVPRHYQIR